MFPVDQVALPPVATRKALVIIDLQADFLAADGALPIADPEVYVSRILNLVTGFRKAGDIVWVRTEFAKHCDPESEQILVTDEAIAAVAASEATKSRSRRRRTRSSVSVESGLVDAEAFLSQDSEGQAAPQCVKAGSPGCELVPEVKAAIQRRDVVFTKSHYSAFKSGQLLQMLRGKFVTELFLCGSLTNVGVYATAMDAVKYGYSITIVEDCCGYRSDLRHTFAIQRLVDYTGCETVMSDDALESLLPAQKSKPTSQPSGPKDGGRETDDQNRTGKTEMPPVRDPTSPRLSAPMAGLKLSGESAARHGEPQTARTTQTQPLQPPVPAIPSTGPPTTVSDSLTEAERSASSSRVSNNKVDPRAEICKDSIDGSSNLNPTEAEMAPGKAPRSTTETMAGRDETDSATANDTGPLCEGDTTVIHDVLPEPLASGIFDKLRDEISWQRMMHQGGEVPRLVAVQGEVAGDGSHPVYRHPADESPPLLPFSPTVRAIKEVAEKHLGHRLNHVLIQFYRDGNDYISEHSDKTLDIVRDSFISNVSLGAERTMVFRTKRADKDPSKPEPTADDLKRRVVRARLPHNSMCRMGLVTNMRWLHAIRQDKRADRDKNPAELAYKSGRISLTFRLIGTFLDKDGTLIWGQGAVGKTQREARPVVNGQTPEAVRMLQAFGTENHASEFDWDAHYGGGFDVLHMSNAPRLFSAADPIANTRVSLMLAQLGLGYAKGSMGSPAASAAVPVDSAPIKFVDSDPAKSVIQGDAAIMLYLDAMHGQTLAQPETAKKFTRFQQGLALLDKWRAAERGKDAVAALKLDLGTWDGYASEADFLAGAQTGIVDCAVWPVLHEIVNEKSEGALGEWKNLRKYYAKMKATDAVAKALNMSPIGSAN